MFDHRTLIVWMLAGLLALSAASALLDGPRSPDGNPRASNSLDPIEVEPETRR